MKSMLNPYDGHLDSVSIGEAIRSHHWFMMSWFGRSFQTTGMFVKSAFEYVYDASIQPEIEIFFCFRQHPRSVPSSIFMKQPRSSFFSSSFFSSSFFSSSFFSPFSFLGSSALGAGSAGASLACPTAKSGTGIGGGGSVTVGSGGGRRLGGAAAAKGRPGGADGVSGRGEVGPPCPTVSATPRQKTSNMSILLARPGRGPRGGAGPSASPLDGPFGRRSGGGLSADYIGTAADLLCPGQSGPAES